MDEEASFANLLSQSTIASKPTWNQSPTLDPWANPFAESSITPASNPFINNESSSSTFESAYLGPATFDPPDEVSPYVQKLEQDVDQGAGTLPDPPSVIAAREQEYAGYYADAGVLDTPQPSVDPFDSINQVEVITISSPPSKPELPAGLIDEDLLAESDPSASLKKAFVKSTPVATGAGKTVNGDREAKPYVFKPAGRGRAGASSPTKGKGDHRKEGKEGVKKDAVGVASGSDGANKTVDMDESSRNGMRNPDKEADAAAPPSQAESAEKNVTPSDGPSTEPVEEEFKDTTASSPPEQSDTSQPKAASHLVPSSVPLPASNDVTPTPTRAVTPTPPSAIPAESTATSSYDRVSVSPLDAPRETDYGFDNLSINGSTSNIQIPPIPVKSPAKESGNGWMTDTKLTSPPTSRFSGKGWAAVDDDDDGGLFGKGGPSLKSDPWGSNGGNDGWGETKFVSTPVSAGPSQQVSYLTYPKS